MKQLNQIDGKRNLGIDLLRMVCMFMIVILHTLGHGGVLGASQIGTSSYAIGWFWESLALCAVNCYALISGYVGCNSSFKYSNIVVLWLQVVFYSVLITVFIALTVPPVDGIAELKLALMPVVSNRYWYFTAYFALYFFIPFLNYIINNFDKDILKKLIITLLVLFSVLQTFGRICSQNDVFRLYDGYSVFWLMVMYIIGGYINKYGIMNGVSKIRLLFIYVSQIMLAWCWKILVGKFIYKFNINSGVPDTFTLYTAPTMIIAAISLLLIFSKIKVSLVSSKLIKFMAPMTFSVYLIHDNSLVRQYIMSNRFSEYASYGMEKLIWLIPCTALVIYIICSFVDLFRLGLFRIFNVKKNIEKLEQKIIEIFTKSE